MTKEEIGMNTAKIYTDSEGNEISLYRMVRREPDWAASRIQEGEKAAELLSQALRAICLTRDYVGEDTLPAIAGWEWYDVGKKLADYLHDDWAEEFYKRINA